MRIRSAIYSLAKQSWTCTSSPSTLQAYADKVRKIRHSDNLFPFWPTSDPTPTPVTRGSGANLTLSRWVGTDSCLRPKRTLPKCHWGGLLATTPLRPLFSKTFRSIFPTNNSVEASWKGGNNLYIFSSTSWPSVPVLDVLIPGHRAALARTIRYIDRRCRASRAFVRTTVCGLHTRWLLRRLAQPRGASECVRVLQVAAGRMHRHLMKELPPAHFPKRSSQRRSRRSSPSSQRSACKLTKNLLAMRRLGVFVLGASLPTAWSTATT